MGVGDASIVESCPARAALAGNPSDGYGGAVVSIPVPARSATVTLASSARFEICHSPSTDDTFGSFVELDRHIGRFGYSGSRELILACIRRFARHTGSIPAPCRIHVSTSIPRSVGLAGSSAIVIATLRALCRHVDHAGIAPDELASLALSVEVDELGFAAGLQDRVVQAFGRPMFMQFAPDQRRTLNGFVTGTYTVLDGLLPASDGSSVFVAYRSHDAEPSQAVHGDLRSRFDAGDQEVRNAMAALAGVAHDAADAIRSGRSARLALAIDASFDIRQSVMNLRPDHVELIDVARHAGAHANFAGSGGAIVVFAPDSDRATSATESLRAIGCEILNVSPPPRR